MSRPDNRDQPDAPKEAPSTANRPDADPVLGDRIDKDAIAEDTIGFGLNGVQTVWDVIVRPRHVLDTLDAGGMEAYQYTPLGQTVPRHEQSFHGHRRPVRRIYRHAHRWWRSG